MHAKPYYAVGASTSTCPAKRIAGNFAGFIAAIIPALTATLFYAQQARPYGVLLGLGALLLLAYQHGTRDARLLRNA